MNIMRHNLTQPPPKIVSLQTTIPYQVLGVRTRILTFQFSGAKMLRNAQPKFHLVRISWLNLLFFSPSFDITLQRIIFLFLPQYFIQDIFAD